MCDNDIQTDQNAVECDDERVEQLFYINANLKLDVNSGIVLLLALQNKQTEFERFKAFNDRTVDYEKLERRLNETLGLLAQKEIDIKEESIHPNHSMLAPKMPTFNEDLPLPIQIPQNRLKDENFPTSYDMLLQECVSKDVMCSYLQSLSDLDEITALQCLYLHKVRECDCLAQKLSEQTEFGKYKRFTLSFNEFC
ncbi:hypothetical protein Tco_1392509 [Tanacetum coccineum]